MLYANKLDNLEEMNEFLEKYRHVYPNVHHSTIYNSQDMEAT